MKMNLKQTGCGGEGLDSIGSGQEGLLPSQGLFFL
jgi:hypothetical protein